MSDVTSCLYETIDEVSRVTSAFCIPVDLGLPALSCSALWHCVSHQLTAYLKLQASSVWHQCFVNTHEHHSEHNNGFMCGSRCQTQQIYERVASNKLSAWPSKFPVFMSNLCRNIHLHAKPAPKGNAAWPSQNGFLVANPCQHYWTYTGSAQETLSAWPRKIVTTFWQGFIFFL